MTAQIPDNFIYKGEKYYLVGLKGTKLFDPLKYNLKLKGGFSGCWRGYVSTYALVESHLVLESLMVRAQEVQEIRGVKPEEVTGPLKTFFNYEYLDLALKLDFTGSLLIAKDQIDAMYVHMGYQRPMAYEDVIELHFLKGELAKKEDVSEAMKSMRQKAPSKDAQPESDSEEDTRRWVEKAFSLDYDLESEEDKNIVDAVKGKLGLI